MRKKLLAISALIAMSLGINSLSAKDISEQTQTRSAPASAGAVAARVGGMFTIGRYLSEVARDVASVSKRELAISEQYKCLAQAIYFEARGEPTIGQAAVAHVVLNRVRDRRYPNTICAVVFQNDHRRHRCQFSFACDGQSDEAYNLTAWNRSLKVALKTLAGVTEDVTLASTHYHADYVAPIWASKLKPTVQFGQHLFYREDDPRLRLANFETP